MKVWAPLGLLVLLCGCSDDLGGASVATGAVAPILAPVSGSAAGAPNLALLVLPADGGSVAAVRERVYPNGVRQEIALRDGTGAASGDAIEVDVGASPSAPEADWLSLDKPTALGVRGEILARFPHMAMEIVQEPAYDRLGPIGLAVGRDASGLRCVFAWQWIDDLRDVDPTRATILKAADSLGGSAAHASIRVRLCRRDRTLDQLAATVEGLALGSSENLRRILAIDHSGKSETEDGSTPGAVLAPLPQSLESALGPAPPPVATRVPTKQAQASPPERQISGGPADSADRPARETRRPAPADRQLSEAGAARYLAPVAAAPVSQEGSEAAPAIPESEDPGPSLPPQALQGPSVSPAGTSADAVDDSAPRAPSAGGGIDSPTP